MKALLIDKELLNRLYIIDGLTTYEIAKQYAVDRTTICNCLRRYNINIRNKKAQHDENKLIRLSAEQKELLYGTMLGDGHISRSNNLARFSISHSIKQEEYIKYKHNILQSVAKEIKSNIAHNKRMNKDYQFLSFVTKSIGDMAELHSMFYKENVKVIREEIIRYIVSPKSLAFWILDDGYLDKTSNRTHICTECFSYNEHLILQKLLCDNFGLHPTIYKYQNSFRLRFGQIDTRKLSSLIVPFVVDSMKYKLVV